MITHRSLYVCKWFKTEKYHNQLNRSHPKMWYITTFDLDWRLLALVSKATVVTSPETVEKGQINYSEEK